MRDWETERLKDLKTSDIRHLMVIVIFPVSQSKFSKSSVSKSSVSKSKVSESKVSESNVSKSNVS